MSETSKVPEKVSKLNCLTRDLRVRLFRSLFSWMQSMIFLV